MSSEIATLASFATDAVCDARVGRLLTSLLGSGHEPCALAALQLVAVVVRKSCSSADSLRGWRRLALVERVAALTLVDDVQLRSLALATLGQLCVADAKAAQRLVDLILRKTTANPAAASTPTSDRLFYLVSSVLSVRPELLQRVVHAIEQRVLCCSPTRGAEWNTGALLLLNHVAEGVLKCGDRALVDAAVSRVASNASGGLPQLEALMNLSSVALASSSTAGGDYRGESIAFARHLLSSERLQADLGRVAAGTDALVAHVATAVADNARRLRKS